MKFPYLIEPRRFLFGLIEVRQWGWRAGLTKPQIDLLLHDQPLVTYKKTGKKGKGVKKDYTGTSIRAKAESALERLEQQRQAGTDGIENFEIKGGTTFKL